MSVEDNTAGRLASAAGLVMIGNLVSRLLGLAREQIIAGMFGASAQASMFVLASRLPVMVYDLIIGGAMTSALVPVFSEYGKDDRRGRLDGALGATIGAALLVLIPVIGLLIIAAPHVIGFMGVGFAPAEREMGMALVRLALPATIILGIASVLMAALYARERFARPSFASALYNLGIILGAFLLTPFLGVTGLVVGLLAGAFFQCIAQLPSFKGVKLRTLINFQHPALRRILWLYAPVAAGMVISVAVAAFDSRLASQTGVGSLAAMRYATTLVQFPLGLVATALSFATLPVLSKQAAALVAWRRESRRSTGRAPDLDDYRATLALTLRLALLFIAPLTVATIVLRQPLVQLVFERGEFTTVGTGITALALFFYAPQLPFVAVDQILIAAFYALQDTRTPVLVGVITAGAYVAVALPLVDSWGMPALVLANTVQNSAHGIILALLLWRLVGGFRDSGFGRATGQVGLASAAMFGTLVVLHQAIIAPTAWLPSFIWAFLLGICGIVALGVYGAVLWILRADDLRYVGEIRSRAWRRISTATLQVRTLF